MRKKNIKKHKQQKTEKSLRLNLVLGVIFLLAGLIVFRLFNLQVINYNVFTEAAGKQHEIWSEVKAKRGEIFIEDYKEDNKYVLAGNKDLGLIYAVPLEIEDAQKTASLLSPILELSNEELLQRLNKKNDLYEPLKRKVEDEKVQEIQKLGLKGIGIQKEAWRYYPEKNFASHVIGFLGYEGDQLKGRYGVEGFYNNILEGKAGFIAEERSAIGAWISVGRREVKQDIKGSDLILTLDRTVQYKAENLLKQALEKWGAESGTIIVMDPRNGAILALANLPDFDLNGYSKVENVNIFNNSAIFDLYEPGSIFKPVVMGIALETHVVSPLTTYTDPCAVSIGGFTITNYNGKCYGLQNMTNVLEKSINTGMVFVARALGSEKMVNGLKTFGFDSLTGVDLDTEAQTILRSAEKWRETNLATAGFGQGIAVTPMQMAMAYSAIVNQGKLVKPHIIKKIIKHQEDGSEIIEEIQPVFVGQVLSSSTAEKLSAMLVSVVENGFSKPARVAGYLVGGKTGTAEVPDKIHGGYDEEKRITSFAGFGPYEDPRFVILIKLDHSQSKGSVLIEGSTTCAPVFKELAKFLFDYYKIPPSEE